MSALDSTKLYGRTITVECGPVKAGFDDSAEGLDVSGFDIDFTAERTLKPEPNTASISIYNLSEKSRKQLSSVPKLSLKLEAGYQGGPTQLFLGEARAAWTERDGPDFITRIESGDNEKEVAKARLVQCLGPKVPISVALQTIVDALGVGKGNLSQAVALLQSKNIATINGSSLTGNAARRMTDICRSAGLEWSIQNGNIQILNIGNVLSTSKAIKISADTGMVNSPTVDSEGIVSASTLIIPGLIPGCLVNFDSLFVKGGYRVQRCRWHGQTYGQDWTCEFEAKKY